MLRKAFKAFVLAACAAFAGCSSGGATGAIPAPSSGASAQQPQSQERVITGHAMSVGGTTATCPTTTEARAVKGIAALPGGIAALPGGIAALPGGIAALPGGIAALPGGIAALPGGIAALPGGIAALPGGIAALPGGTASACTATVEEAVHVTAMLGGKHEGDKSCPPDASAKAKCGASVRSDIAPIATAYPNPANVPGLHPADLIDAYKLPKGGGVGQTVAIVDAFDDPNAEADMAVYRQEFGMAPCTSASGCFVKLGAKDHYVPGDKTDYPKADAGWSMEIALDLDMVSATCPNCHIILVEAKSDALEDLGKAVDTAVAAGATVVSNSYYAAESILKQDDIAHATPHYTVPGVPMTASSGDHGYGTTFPASLPDVVAVGGTTLNRLPTGRGWYETVWHGSGAGCSSFISKPGWQRDPGCAKRTVSDVAVVADPDTGVSIYNSYGARGWYVAGGTSAGAPLVASMIALAGHPAQFSNAKLYASSALLFPINVGSDGTCNGSYLCEALGGYNGPTGLGTPNGVGAF